MNSGDLNWSALADDLDRLLDLDAHARETLLARIEATDIERAAALRRWLKSIERSDGLMQTPRGNAPSGTGPWRALERVGQGGMGEVWRGERADGAFTRTVAIKFLRADREQARASIAHERALLARLRHPGIAQLIDGGVADDGTPYLVTEWVEGQRLDLWANASPRPLRERVRLMHEIARAVAYAHTQLVVHRDLKPANVMVERGGAPRLLDFGIARVLGDKMQSTLTRDGALTPAFAAPEQLRGEAIGTHTDVYALGGLLYFVLTGRTPHGIEDASLATVVARVCEQDAPAPSAQARGQGIDADLDAIVLKALAREPARRYGSADALAADLARWLSGDLVEARLPGTLERAQRFARRHWLPVSLATGMMLALLAGLIGTVMQWRTAERARLAAEAERATAVRELSRSQSLRAGFIAAFRDAGPGEIGPANYWLDRVAEHVDTLAGDDALDRVRLLEQLAELENDRWQPERARALYQRLLKQHGAVLDTESRARAQCGLARAYASLAQTESARTALRAGLALAEPLQGAARTTYVYCLSTAIGDDGQMPSPDRLPELRQALAELDALGDVPDARWLRASLMHALGTALDLSGDAAGALAHYREALEFDRVLGRTQTLGAATTLGAIAGLEMQQGDLQGADRDYDAALALSERVAGRTLTLAIDLANHAGLKNNLGQHQAAAERARRALSILDGISDADNVTRGNAELELGKALERLGQYADAEAALARAERAFVAAVGEQHDYARFPRMTLARVYLGQGNVEAARATIEQTLAWYRARESKGAIAACLSINAHIARVAGDVAAAHAAATELVEIQRGRGDPEHWRVAAAEAELAEVEDARGEWAAALSLLDHAEPILVRTFGDTHWRVAAARAIRSRR
jgi:tetratricopeptide (TPR) repeat protein